MGGGLNSFFSGVGGSPDRSVGSKKGEVGSGPVCANTKDVAIIVMTKPPKRRAWKIL